MASRARKPAATGIRLVAEIPGVTEIERMDEIVQIAVSPGPVRETEVVDDPVEAQWLSLIRWLGDKQTRGDHHCRKAERMINSLIRGGGVIHADNIDGTDRLHGLPDFSPLRRGRFMVLVSKSAGTNKTRPMFGSWKLTDPKLLRSTKGNAESPEPIGHFKPDERQIPHAILTLTSNWVTELRNDKAREAMVCDLLQLVSWKGELDTSPQPFELVGHDIVVNETTLALYGDSVNDAFLAARGIKTSGKATQLGFPSDLMSRRDDHRAAQEYLDNLGAMLYRPSDGAVLDIDGDVLFLTVVPASQSDAAAAALGDDDGPESNPDDPGEAALDDYDPDEDDEPDDDE